ncbi:MAG: hypothetical protein H6Q86_3778, partial [candidate division NC10 bacterium]|nr:hypothetical protein [candidate division NC10 bacterium]
KYTFAAESHAEKNYFTEKLVDAILSECLCFYWGCPNLSDYIDPRAYIRLDLDDFDAAAHTITTAIAQGEWERRIDFIRREKRKILEEYQVFPTLQRIVTDARSSLLRKAQRLHAEGQPLAEVSEAYEKAFREDPTRAEPLWELAQFLPDREAKCRVLERIKDLLPPHGGDGARELYDWRILDELAMNMYYTGRYAASFDAYDELLQRPSLPSRERPRIEANLRFTLAKLPLPDIVVVNLERRPDRLSRFQQQAAREGLTAYRRFAAVDGRQLCITDAIRHLFRGNDFGYRRSIIGCALSHLEIWRSLAQPALILEDDVELADAFLFKLHSVLRQARQLDGPWDIIFLGWHPWAALQAEVPRHTAHPTLIRMTWRDFMGGSFAYLLSPSGAAKLGQRAHERGVQNGIDWFVMHHADCLRAYRTALPIAWSASARKDGVTDSDIQYDWAPLN